MPTQHLIDRIAQKIDFVDGCWLWTGAIDKSKGYGYVRDRGVTRRVHRSTYELLVGRIPDGLQLDHLCRNRACVNPDHLEPVTGAENSRRGLNAKLSEAEAREIKFSTDPAKEAAARYGVHHSTIYAIRTGWKWKNLTPDARKN